MRFAGAVLVLCVVAGFGGCGKNLVRRGAEPEPIPVSTAETQVGQGLLDATPPAPPTTDTDGRFELQLVDQNGNPSPAGIPVEIRGARDLEVQTDGSGVAVLVSVAGDYTFKVPARCTDALHVRSGGTGRLGIAAGGTGTGRTEVIWERRYGPWSPVFASVQGDWPPGEVVRLRYEVIDRCTESTQAPGRDISTYRYEPAGNLEIVGQPAMRSDDKGYGYVDVRCRSAGATSLVLLDSTNPSDRIDLVDKESTSPQPPRCRG